MGRHFAVKFIKHSPAIRPLNGFLEDVSGPNSVLVDELIVDAEGLSGGFMEGF
jgi:hypothetical protein